MPGTNLTRSEAAQRAEIISVNSYDIELDLARGDETFTSVTTISFSAVEGSETFLDLVADSVESLSINGVDHDPASAFADSRITLSALKAENTVRVESTQRFTNTGEGLHRFVDPADGETYLYSQFEVPDSRRVFAVFEQPDLKATFRFTVTAPAAWEVFSNQPTPTPIAAGERDGRAISTWAFSPTPVMSSYITAVIAGPYFTVRDSLTSSDGRTIPLAIACRASLKEYLDADYIIAKTREGFEFFEREFQTPYPFEKYDQIFVPEFNAGAMENVGAVTFTDAYVFRSQVTDAMRERRVVTILHELAHMWFGDLVTMQWWNDLWLNESFAEFMSTLGVAEATEWSDCWTTFTASEKSWAYRQDQLPSTHPIVAEIRDLDDVLVNFDGITYAKGASVLKQMVAWVGREPFMQAVHDYFAEFHHANATLHDLLRHLSAQSGRDLEAWSAVWLETAGVNTLRAEFSTDPTDDTFTAFAIRQTADPDYPTIRPHKLRIAALNRTGDLSSGVALTQQGEWEIDIDGPETSVPELVGTKRPDLLLVNAGDLTFAKIRLDERSLETTERALSSIEHSLTRGVLWGALWDATRDGELPAQRFIDTVIQHIGSETASTTLRTVLGQVTTAATIYTAPARRAATIARLADAMWQLASSAPAGSDRQFQFVQNFAALATTSEQLDVLAGLASGTLPIDGLDIDTDLGWELLIGLATSGRVTPQEVADRLAEDPTASGQQSAAHALAAMPGEGAKLTAWNSVFADDSAPNLVVRATGRGFLRTKDLADLEPFITRYFDTIIPIWESRSFSIAEELLDGFYPRTLASEQLATATREWLDSHFDAPPALRRMLIEHLADVERALVAQAADQAAA